MTTPRPPAQGGASIVAYRLGGRDYPLRTNAQCFVCLSPWRLRVEEGLVQGYPYVAIVRELPEDSGLSARHVASHYKGGHLPYDVEVMRRIVEARAEKLGRSIEEGIDSLVDQVTLAEVVVQRVFEGVASGELRPDVAEGLAAAKLLQQVEQEVDGGDKAAWTEAVMIYFDLTRRVMSGEQYAELGKLIATNPILRALRQRHDDQGQPAIAS